MTPAMTRWLLTVNFRSGGSDSKVSLVKPIVPAKLEPARLQGEVS
jgi:hypothetical protein